jgi:hypothetical protein
LSPCRLLDLRTAFSIVAPQSRYLPHFRSGYKQTPDDFPVFVVAEPAIGGTVVGSFLVWLRTQRDRLPTSGLVEGELARLGTVGRLAQLAVQDADQSERSPEAPVGRIPEDLTNGTADRASASVPRVGSLAGKRETEGNKNVAECRLKLGPRISWPIHVVLTEKQLKRVIIFYPGGGLGRLDVRSRRECLGSKRARMGLSSAMRLLDGPKTRARVRRGKASWYNSEERRDQ